MNVLNSLSLARYLSDVMRAINTEREKMAGQVFIILNNKKGNEEIL